MPLTAEFYHVKISKRKANPDVSAVNERRENSKFWNILEFTFFNKSEYRNIILAIPAWLGRS